MTRLKRESNLADPDAAYRAIVEAHRGLTEAESAALDARLILILANHIGDIAVLREALTLARQAASPAPTQPSKGIEPPGGVKA